MKRHDVAKSIANGIANVYQQTTPRPHRRLAIELEDARELKGAEDESVEEEQALAVGAEGDRG